MPSSPQCLYGARPKSGAPDYVWVTWNAFLTWIVTRFARLGSVIWLWFPDAPFNVVDFCADEILAPDVPPVDVWAKAFIGDPISAATVGTYLSTLFRQNVWNSVCECTPPAGGTCGSVWPTGKTFNRPFAAGTAYELGTKFKALQSGSVFYGARIWYKERPPSDFTSLDLWDTVTNTLVSNTNFNTAIVGANDYLIANGTAGNTTPYPLVTGREYIVAYCSPAAISGWETDDSTPPSDAIISYIDDRYTPVCGQRPTATFAGWDAINPFICIGGPPAGTTPTFTPVEPTVPAAIPDNTDPACSTIGDICNKLLQLAQEMKYANMTINWIQSQLSPQGWSPQATVTGLTGHGTVAASDIVGVRVQCAVPSAWGYNYETPKRYIPQIAAVAFEVNGVQENPTQVHYADQHIFGAPAATTGVHYVVARGVTCSITPLGRLK